MNKSSKIYVAGHTGLVGSALIRTLCHDGYTNIITQTLEQLDLRNQKAVDDFFKQEQPEYVFLAAAKVGGIKANNDFPAEFIYENLMIVNNVIDAAYRYHVKKLLFLGSSCIYPRNCPQPIKEEYLMTGALEKTNEPYALAKIAGIGLCQAYNRQYGTNFIACMPTNLYGPFDNFDRTTSHVLPALLAKMCDAVEHNTPFVEVWGDGTPMREFLFVDDLADALIFLMQNYNENVPINVGTGCDISILELAFLIKEIVGFKGTLVFDSKQPTGTPRKVLDVSRLHELGWKSATSLQAGIIQTVEWYMQHTMKRDQYIAYSQLTEKSS
jgi:GDP-L-fucose synthase